MRFLLVSTHIDQTTGYSKVSYALLKQLGSLAPKVKTFHFGFQRHPNRPSSRKTPEGVIVYDAAANEEPKEDGFGFNKIHEYIETINPDVVMIYNDPLIIHRFIEAMKYNKETSPYKIWCYVDQVYNGIATPLVKTITDNADKIFCFTEEWKTRFMEQYSVTQDVYVLGHSLDASIFTQMNKSSRTSLRKHHNIPEDAILFLNVNRNSQRKRLDLTIQSFVRLLHSNLDKPFYLMLATNMNPQAGAYYDCMRIFTEECKGIGLNPMEYQTRCLIIDTAPPHALTDNDINNLYNMTDIGINTSDGEGFGLCQLEHLYTGAPQIVTDVGSYHSFLDESVATFVKPTGDRLYMAGSMPLGLYMDTFRVEDVANAMLETYTTLEEKRHNVKKYKFKSWAKVCDGFLEMVHSLN